MKIELGSRSIKVSSPDRIYFPAHAGRPAITKGEICDYYARISDRMYTRARNRPMSMHRFPRGIEQKGFFQQNILDSFPDWIQSVEVERSDGKAVLHHTVCTEPAVLVWMAVKASITHHMWQSRADCLDHPDRLVFDLDPPGDAFELARQAARLLGELFDESGVRAFLMTTGSSGLHVVVHLEAVDDYETARALSREIADIMVLRAPDALTTEFRKAKRKGRLLVDYYRNGQGQHTVTPWSVRAKPGAPIATLLEWDELDNPDLDAQSFNVHNIFERLDAQTTCPWADVESHRYSVAALRRKVLG